MTSHCTDSDQPGPVVVPLDVWGIRIDRTWWEHHWGGRVTPARPHRPLVERRAESGLDALSTRAVGVIVGL